MYTPLTALVGEIFAQMDQAELPPPQKMKTSERKRDPSKYCRYHSDHRHDTDHYWKLKDEIEKLIQRGLLRQYVGKNDNRPPKNDGKKDIEEILMIEGGSSYSGSSNRCRKAFVRKVRAGQYVGGKNVPCQTCKIDEG